MSLSLEPRAGALRARLDETQWSAVWSASVPEDVVSQVAPLPLPLEPDADAAAVTVPEAIREAVRVATGPTAVLTLELATLAESRGVLAGLGTDGTVAAGVVRRVVVPDPAAAASAGALPAPGVEVSAFSLGQLVGETLRLFPPDAPMSGTGSDEPIRLPAEWAVVLSRAVHEHDEAMLRQVAAGCGWDDVPELLVSLVEDLRASATLTLRVAGSQRVDVRRWWQCHLGWVAVELAGGSVTHRLRTAQQLREDLVRDLSGALDAVVSGGG